MEFRHRKEVNWVLEFSIEVPIEYENMKKRQCKLLFCPFSECVNMSHRSVKEDCGMHIATDSILHSWGV
jgi:hypothetical protein